MSKLRDPQSLHDLLLFRLTRLTATAGAMVVRLCEGGYGITRREWRLMLILAEHHALQPSELADRAQLDRARTSRAITSLVDKQLAHRTTLLTDRRQAVIALTDKGLGLHATLFPQVVAINQQLLQGLDDAALAAFESTIQQLQQRAEDLWASSDLPKADRRRGGRKT